MCRFLHLDTPCLASQNNSRLRWVGSKGAPQALVSPPTYQCVSTGFKLSLPVSIGAYDNSGSKLTKMLSCLCTQRWLRIYFPLFFLCMGGAVASAQTYSYTPSSLTWSGTGVGLEGIAKSVTIFNTGTTSITVNSYSLSPQFNLVFGWSAYVIPAGKQFAFGVKFVPTVLGTASGQLTIVINGTNVVIPLTGTALATNAKVSVLPSSLFFGQVPVGTVSAPQTLTIKNVGTSSMKVQTVTADPPFAVTGFSGVPMTLRAGQSLVLQVTFTGTVAQKFSDLLTISYAVFCLKKKKNSA